MVEWRNVVDRSVVERYGNLQARLGSVVRCATRLRQLGHDLVKRDEAPTKRSDHPEVLCQRHMVVVKVGACNNVMRVIRQYNRTILCHDSALRRVPIADRIAVAADGYFERARLSLGGSGARVLGWCAMRWSNSHTDLGWASEWFSPCGCEVRRPVSATRNCPLFLGLGE